MGVLAQNPNKWRRQEKQLGKEYPHAEMSYQKLHVKRHLIFYRIENKTCIIIRILHDRMDIKQHLT